MVIFYDSFFILFAVIYFPYLCLKGKWHNDFVMRFGFFPGSLRRSISSRKNIWVHAVSVGEVLAVAKLIRGIKEQYPSHQIVVSTVTTTGFKMACLNFPQDIVIYAPVDFSFSVNRYIKLISPQLYIAAETEIWPNLFHALSKKSVPIIQVNGRISDKAFNRYRLVQFILRPILNCVRLFCVQSEQDAKRIIALGAKEKNVRITGNMKFDDLPEMDGPALENLGLNEGDAVLVGGSTHPGEEEILVNIFRELSKEFSSLRLIIAPRHIERADDIFKLIEKQGLRAQKFSQIKNEKPQGRPVIVVDAMGHLRLLYKLAKIVFVGKSLTKRGGQNIIEPACFAKPIIVGPWTENFKDVVNIFARERSIIQVNDERELLNEVRNLLKDPQQAQRLGSLAKNVVQKNQGATKRTLEIITKEAALA
ncbi:MAG: 3-deoxy-D-manno-octulosonic acid transferase [Candidatus Omnitrophota bacterium]